jgi:hypothetical protein
LLELIKIKSHDVTVLPAIDDMTEKRKAPIDAGNLDLTPSNVEKYNPASERLSGLQANSRAKISDNFREGFLWIRYQRPF